jgi:hypothetical protein
MEILMTAIDRVFDTLLVQGKELTTKQIAARYNVANPADVVYRLRSEGYDIYTNKRVDTKGRVSQKYRAGMLVSQ